MSTELLDRCHPRERHSAPTGKVIVFINCNEEMACGMRMLAAMARDMGFPVHVIVLRGYHVTRQDKLDETTSSMHVCVNGRFHSNADKSKPFNTEELSLLRRKLLDLAPQLICVSTRSVNDDIMPDLLHAAGKACPGTPIICGGYGPTYAPEHYLRNGAAVVVRGEGEIPFVQLLDNLRKGRPLCDISNACWLKNNEIHFTPLAPPLKDISVLPSPLVGDDAVTFIETIADKNGSERTTLAERDPAYDDTTFYCLIGRGCIGSCTYCAAPVLRRQYAAEGQHMPKYRRRDYEQILRELEAAKRNGATRIFFKDEYLVDAPDRLEVFFRQYMERVNLPFRGNFHPDQLMARPSLLNALLDAGMYGFTIGFEAGTEDMARHVYGRPHSFENLKNLASILAGQFVALQYHFVSGTSLNTEEELRSKCSLIASLPYDPVAHWRTMLMEFQFFPQPCSSLTENLNSGAITRQPVRQWALWALRAQLRQVMAEDKARYVEQKAMRRDDALAFLQRHIKEYRISCAANHVRGILQGLANRDVLLMGDDAACERFKKASACRVAARIAWRGGQLNVGIAPEHLKKNFGESIPLLLLNASYNQNIPRLLRRKCHIANPIHGITV